MNKHRKPAMHEHMWMMNVIIIEIVKTWYAHNSINTMLIARKLEIFVWLIESRKSQTSQFTINTCCTLMQCYERTTEVATWLDIEVLELHKHEHVIKITFYRWRLMINYTELVEKTYTQTIFVWLMLLKLRGYFQ